MLLIPKEHFARSWKKPPDYVIVVDCCNGVYGEDFTVTTSLLAALLQSNIYRRSSARLASYDGKLAVYEDGGNEVIKPQNPTIHRNTIRWNEPDIII